MTTEENGRARKKQSLNVGSWTETFSTMNKDETKEDEQKEEEQCHQNPAPQESKKEELMMIEKEKQMKTKTKQSTRRLNQNWKEEVQKLKWEILPQKVEEENEGGL